MPKSNGLARVSFQHGIGTASSHILDSVRSFVCDLGDDVMPWSCGEVFLNSSAPNAKQIVSAMVERFVNRMQLKMIGSLDVKIHVSVTVERTGKKRKRESNDDDDMSTGK